jgi:Ca2+/Na+ antiporter
MDWLNITFAFLNIIWMLFICFIGCYFIFISIKTEIKKDEIAKEDIKEIEREWYVSSPFKEISIEYVYTKACRFERCRINTMIGMFILGLTIICFGIAQIIENINEVLI